MPPLQITELYFPELVFQKNRAGGITMADERQFGTQELFSARYMADAEQNVEPEVEEPARRARPQRSGPEQMVRWLTLLVPVMLIAAAGGLYWLNRDSISSTAGELNRRRSVFDLLLWAGGSEETFQSALSDRLERARRDSAFQFDQKPAFETEFDDADFENLTNSWNFGS
jgi:hypothetical protein